MEERLSVDVAVPAISVVIPVKDGAAVLPRCLDALRQSQGVAWECIVVDDGSTDESASIAERANARLFTSDQPGSGPGRARNLGAAKANAPLVCFIDSDVVVRPDTLASFVALFQAQPSLAAAFGSYDAQPHATNPLSQYRNLLHHFVHQNGRDEASTFWAGCGAVRRDVFLELGGFSPEYTRASIEDIELGYRLWRDGKDIRLAKHIQVTHLKRWTFWSILRTDIRDRALPWTALIRRTGHLPNDLNLQLTGRISAGCVLSLPLLLLLGVWAPEAWIACAACFALLIACNRHLYRFFIRHRGIAFCLQVVPMHWLYFGYSTLIFAFGTLTRPWPTPSSPPTGASAQPTEGQV